MCIFNTYRKLASYHRKSASLCALKSRKCSRNRITLTISIVKCLISVKMRQFLRHFSANSAASSAFSAWKHPNKNSTLRAQRFSQRTQRKVGDRVGSPHVSKGSGHGLFKRADERPRYRLSWIDLKLEPLLTCGLRTRARGILIRREFLYSIQLILIFGTEIL